MKCVLLGLATRVGILIFLLAAGGFGYFFIGRIPSFGMLIPFFLAHILYAKQPSTDWRGPPQAGCGTKWSNGAGQGPAEPRKAGFKMDCLECPAFKAQ